MLLSEIYNKKNVLSTSILKKMSPNRECTQTRSKIIAEWSLRKMNAPIGVSEFRLTTAIPKEFKPNLPSIEEIETELSKPIKKSSKAKNKKQQNAVARRVRQQHE
jgi:hypothetical protein